MRLLEYQAKNLLRSYGVAIPLGRVASTPKEAGEIARETGGSQWFVKAQILAGDRSQADGVRRCLSFNDVEQQAQSMLGSRLITSQTSEQGCLVHQVYVEEACVAERECYIALTLNRSQACLTWLACYSGGTNVETQPRHVWLSRDFYLSISPSDIHVLHTFFQFPKNTYEDFFGFLDSIFMAYTKCDASLVEINPFILTHQGIFMALDAKITIDPSALYRQKWLESAQKNQSFGWMEGGGNIACCVNGAGLAMATLDLIHNAGGKTAGVWDIGGGASYEYIHESFLRFIRDSRISVILVNIFGGMMKCEHVAKSLINIRHETNIPMVVRFAGTGNEEGKAMLMGIPLIYLAENSEDAVALAISFS